MHTYTYAVANGSKPIKIPIHELKTEKGYDLLLQKRSKEKDSFPGCYDISSAGHISAGDEPLETALRELEEELGIKAEPEQLKKVCMHEGSMNGNF